MKKNVANQRVYFSLFKDGARVENPTMAAGDFKVAIDGGAQNNVNTLPTTDAAGKVYWAPIQSETNGDYITFLARDAAGDEWEPLTLFWETEPHTLLANYLDAAVSGLPSANNVRDAILDDATRFSGADIAAILTDTGTTLDTIVDAILVDTGTTIPALINALNNLSGADVLNAITSDGVQFQGADIAAILTDTGTTLPALINALNDLSAADVMAQLVAIGLDHLVSAAVVGADVADDSIIAQMVSANPAAADWDDFDNQTDSLEAIGDALIMAAVFPAGAIEFTYTIYEPDGVTPIAGVDTWISTDLAGANIVWRGVTDAFGVAYDVLNQLPNLDAGTYYFWRQAAGYTFANPDTEIVS